MMLQLTEHNNPFDQIVIEPLREMAAYEAMWDLEEGTFKKIADKFKTSPGSRPSDFVSDEHIETYVAKLSKLLKESGLYKDANILINSAYQYPYGLRDAKNPVELLYYKGDINILNTRSVAIVGTRNPSDLGVRRTQKLVRMLVKDGFTIASGLAKGVDTVAHTTAIKSKGLTFAVIGTPLNEYYPKENKELQELIAEQYLLVSQVPFFKYQKHDYRYNRSYFPERNKTMSALTEATVIVEAGETSGTLIQARAALYQGRKLFILNSCFENPNITWPARFEKMGAVRVRDYEDIIKQLG